MSNSDKQRAIEVFRRAYDHMLQETSGKRCISKGARQRIWDELFDVSVFDYPASIARLAMLLMNRMDDPGRFELLEDLDYLDALKDIVDYGAPQGWRITANCEWRWEE